MKPSGCHWLFICAIFLDIFFFPSLVSCAMATPADTSVIEQGLSPAEVAQRFLNAYPDFLTAYDTLTQELIGWDGARFPVAASEKNNCQNIATVPPINPPSSYPPPCCPPPSSPMETLRIRYRPVAEHWPTENDPPQPNEDAGRLRPLALWAYMYGTPAAKNADGSWQTKKIGKRVELVGGDVEKNLSAVSWTLAGSSAKIRVTRINGVDKQLAAVVAELESISAEAKTRYRRLHGGGKIGVSGFYPRLVRASNCEISPHAFGVAVDVHWQSGLDYWLDSPQRGGYRYHPVMPKEIVAVFERHGFIWGGKWRHFDGMHFEYRPELLNMTMPSVGRPSVGRRSYLSGANRCDHSSPPLSGAG